MASQARYRGTAKPPASGDASPNGTGKSKAEAQSSWSIIEILRIIVGLIVLVGAMFWIITGESVIFKYRELPTLIGAAKRYLRGPISLTDDELALYNGTDPRLPIYVGLNGSVYDVSASPQTYGPSGSYAFFAGRDATRAFLTGCFQEDLSPDLRGVEDMYIPIDEPSDIEGMSRAEIKMRRERDARLARKQMQGTIAHWGEVFAGKTGRPYFWVGTIEREEGWMDKLPKRELCKQAAEGRPKRADVERPTYKSGQKAGS